MLYLANFEPRQVGSEDVSLLRDPASMVEQ